MYKIKNLLENDDIRTVEQHDGMTVIEYMRDLSVMPDTSVLAYYCAEMNVRKRQLVINLEDNEYTISAGAMQWMAGNVVAAAESIYFKDLKEDKEH